MATHHFHSKNIVIISYENGRLSLTFKNGKVYTHTNVPDSVYHELIESEFKKTYYFTNIKGKKEYHDPFSQNTSAYGEVYDGRVPGVTTGLDACIDCDAFFDFTHDCSNCAKVDNSGSV